MALGVEVSAAAGAYGAPSLQKAVRAPSAASFAASKTSRAGDFLKTQKSERRHKRVQRNEFIVIANHIIYNTNFLARSWRPRASQSFRAQGSLAARL